MAQPESLQYTDSFFVAGVDSFSSPDKLGPGEICSGMNVVVRGGVVQTRPGSATLLSIPGESIQGFTLFTPASGVPHQVIAIDGYVYVSAAPFAEYRRLPDVRFSNTSKFVVFENCLKSTDYTADGELIFISKPYNVLMMQDGVTRAAFWDGSTSRHLNPTPGTLTDANGERITQVGLDEAFIGLWMKWSGNRLWVSRDGMLFASDIGNPLKFTEAQYINEGRAFYLPGDCTGMIETPEQDGLIVFTIDNGTLFQTSIQDRTQWLSTPNFQKIVFSNIGCAAPLSLVKQYGLIWWFSPMGLINSDQAFALNRSSRIDIQDNEMMCSKGNIGPDISGICACSYENYLLCSVPSGDVYNRHTWCLDQAVFEGPLNAWNSYWTGWRPVQWAVGNVNGVQRVFFASKDYNGCLKIWEANLPERKDNGAPITCFAQFRQNDFGRPTQLKRFTYAELNLQEILGDVSVMVAVGGRKGGYTRILTKEIAATEGAIYGDTIYDINSCMYGHRPQTRIIKTQENVEPTRCNKGGIEGVHPNDVDLTFGLLVVWSGRMGVAGYLAQSVVFEDQAAGNCEDAEDNPNSLSEQGCSDKDYFVNTCAFPLITGSGSAEAYCAASSGNISAVATATSIISQADADRKAYWAAYIEAEQQCRNCPETIYINARQRYTAVCPEGSIGSPVTATVEAGTYSSTVSQSDANAQALAEATSRAISQLSCQGEYILDLTSEATDGSAFDGAIGINVYIYDGVSSLRFIRAIPYSEFGALVDLTDTIVDAWSDSSESVLFFAHYQTYSVDSEANLDVSLTSSTAVSEIEIEGVSGDYSGPYDSEAISIPVVTSGSFVATVAIPPSEFGHGSFFHAKGNSIYSVFPTIPLYSFGDFTFEFAIKISSSPSPDNFGRMVNNNFLTGMAINYRSGDAIAIEGTLSGITTVSPASTVALDTWQHWAFKRTGSEMKILRNGVVVQTAAVATTTLNLFSSGEIRFGTGGGVELIEAYTSDFRMWNYARSDAEIADNYQSRMTGMESGLVCYYPLSESDSNFMDATGNNVPLLFSNGAYPVAPSPSCGYSSETPPWFPA
jgi:hypothetical protein